MSAYDRYVEIERCAIHPANRKRLGNLDELTADVKEHGVEVPLIGRQLDDGTFQVLAGARRLTAAKAAGLECVPFIEWQAPANTTPEEADHMALVFLIRENANRLDVHPLDDQEYFQRWIEDNPNWTPEMIAAEIGRSTSFVYQRLQLGKLTPAWKKLLEAGRISVAVATDVARVSTLAQDECHAQFYGGARYDNGDGPAPWEIRRYLRHRHTVPLSKASWKLSDETLDPTAGACTTCAFRTGNTPDLFGDLTEKDSCTKRGCYDRKAELQLARAVEKLEQEGTEWYALKRHYDNTNATFKGKRALQDHDWTEGPKKDHPNRGVLVDADDRGRLIWFQMERMSRHEASPQAKAAEAREKRKRKVELETRRLAFAELAKQSTSKPPSVEEWRAITADALDRAWHEIAKAVIGVLYPTFVIEKNHSLAHEFGKKMIPNMSVADCLRVIRLLSVGVDLKDPSHWKGQDLLMERCELLGIDVDPLRAAAELKHPKAKAKKGAKKGKKAKAKAGAA